jgi:hypothetical protein
MSTRAFRACVVVIAMLTISVPTCSHAWGLYGGVSAGGRFTNTSDLNSHLPANIGQFPDGQYSLGYDINFLIMDSHLMLVIEGRGGLSSQLVNGNVRGNIIGFEQTTKLGIIPWSTGNLLIYPLVGIGEHHARMDVSDFSSLTIVRASAKNLIMDIGFGMDYLLRTGGKGGLAIGIRGGYVFPLQKRYWNLDEDVVNDLDININQLPHYSGGGPYLSIVFGGGWFDL